MKRENKFNQRLQVLVSGMMLEDLVKIAKEEGRSLSSLIRMFIVKGIKEKEGGEGG